MLPDSFPDFRFCVIVGPVMSDDFGIWNAWQWTRSCAIILIDVFVIGAIVMTCYRQIINNSAVVIELQSICRNDFLVWPFALISEKILGCSLNTTLLVLIGLDGKRRC